MICSRCHRPLKHASPTGLGPKCSKIAPRPTVYERDLFGFDPEKATTAARERLAGHIESLAAEANIALRHAFRRARVALGVWSA